MLCRETPHRLPGSCLPGCPRPVPPGPTSLLLWGSELLGSSGGQDLPGSLAFPIHPHRLLLRSPVGWGRPLHPTPTPGLSLSAGFHCQLWVTLPPHMLCQVSWSQQGPIPERGCLPFWERWGVQGNSRVWGQESPRRVRSGPRRKGGAGVPAAEGQQKAGLREPRRGFGSEDRKVPGCHRDGWT